MTVLIPVNKYLAFFSKMPFINSQVRLAFVGYRDFGDAPRLQQFEVLDFTDSVDVFHQFCWRLAADGGDDTPEDVFGGLEKVNALDWSTDGWVIFGS
jgi:hypothetical protein